jgi:hypothetical protein
LLAAVRAIAVASNYISPIDYWPRWLTLAGLSFQVLHKVALISSAAFRASPVLKASMNSDK